LISSCTHCGAQYQLPDKMLGKQARCKSCKRLFVIVPTEDEVDLPEPTGSTASTMTPVQDEEDGLDALASAASGADFAPASRSGSSSRARHHDDGGDEPRGRRRMAKGAKAAMAMGITSCVITAAGLVLMIIAMVNGKDTSLLVTLGLITIGLLAVGAVFSMIAVVNGTGAKSKIRRARHPLGGKSEATTGSITGAIALAVIFICAITIGIYLANSGGIQFKEVVDSQGNVVTEDDAQNASASEGELVFWGSGFLIVIIIGSILSAGFWIWMLIDCCTKKFPNDTDKIIWVLVILLTGVIGAIIYLIFGRPKPMRRRR